MLTKKSIGLALVVWLLWFEIFPAVAWAAKLSRAGNPIIPVLLHNTIVQAEVVSSPKKLRLGLGGRRRLAWGTAMLFVMPTFAIQEFCMDRMLIPIDIIWISQNRIIGFHQNLSPPETGTFLSPAPADLVLEVPAGFVKAAGLQVGDPVARLE